MTDILSGISRNECICDDHVPGINEKEPDAHIVAVPEWRLQKVQSPIQLKHEDSNEYDHFDPLEFHGHWDSEGSATFTNNGYTGTLRFVDRELPVLKGGPLHDDSFVFEQLHFHWSEDDHSGCEHIFEDQTFCMEAHAVHYNTKYESFEEAADKHDGLAVVAFFLKATDDECNPCFKKLSDAVKDIVKIDTTTTVPADCLTWFWDAAHCKGYYTYQGSLTTTPYHESVTWILYPTPIHISREQGKAAACGTSIVKVAHQMVSEQRQQQPQTIPTQAVDFPSGFNASVRRGSRSLPASPLVSPSSSPKAHRKLLGHNKYFTGAFTEGERNGSWILAGLLGKRDALSRSVTTVSEEASGSVTDLSVVEDDLQTKMPAKQVFRAKPSELREMNFWSPTSM